LKPDSKFSLLSTRLISWKKSEREKLFASSPEKFDVSSYVFDDQFPRPWSQGVMSYLQVENEVNLFKFIYTDGAFLLNVASVARNFISVREHSDNTSNCFTFNSKKDMLIFLAILCSKPFFEYWKTIGDGFHLTKTNVLNFPVKPEWVEKCQLHLKEIEAAWSDREKFSKSRMISSKKVVSYDFSECYSNFLEF
jgi:hypothetical protein